MEISGTPKTLLLVFCLPACLFLLPLQKKILWWHLLAGDAPQNVQGINIQEGIIVFSLKGKEKHCQEAIVCK